MQSRPSGTEATDGCDAMGKWIVKTNGDPDDAPLMTISNSNGAVSLHMPSPDPVVVTTRKAEEIRWAMAAAIAAAQAGPAAGASHVDV